MSKLESLYTLYLFFFVVRLLDAYKAQDSVKDRELLLSTLKYGKNQRYWTFDLSLKVCECLNLWGRGVDFE